MTGAAVVPGGLTRCTACGEFKGICMEPDPFEGEEPEEVEALCLCSGLRCNACGSGRRHRPISNYYDETTGTIVHVPYFGAMLPCPVCRASDWTLLDGFSPLRDDDGTGATDD